MKAQGDYVLFAHLEDKDRRENKCKFNTLKTFLLGISLEKAGLPRQNSYGKTADITSMRHTGFMLELADLKARGMMNNGTDIIRFAENGLTSRQMIEEVYLSHLDRFDFSAEAVRRSKEHLNEMLLVRRIGHV